MPNDKHVPTLDITLNDASLADILRYLTEKMEDMEERLSRFELKEKMGEYYDYMEMMIWYAKNCKSFKQWEYTEVGDIVRATFECDIPKCPCSGKGQKFVFDRRDKKQIEVLKKEVDKALKSPPHRKTEADKERER